MTAENAKCNLKLLQQLLGLSRTTQSTCLQTTQHATICHLVLLKQSCCNMSCVNNSILANRLAKRDVANMDTAHWAFLLVPIWNALPVFVTLISSSTGCLRWVNHRPDEECRNVVPYHPAVLVMWGGTQQILQSLSINYQPSLST